MAKANILNTRTINYMELIGNGKLYRVPPYQRDYSWSQEQWEDLWNDIVELSPRAEDRHYMGALVVEGTSDREFLVIDGQQRLATLSLLALAVIDRLQRMAGQGIDVDANEERGRELRNRFIGEKDPASLTESTRLYLNETDNPFYQDYLVQLREPLNDRGPPVPVHPDHGRRRAEGLYRLRDAQRTRPRTDDHGPPQELPVLAGEGGRRPGSPPAPVAIPHGDRGTGAVSGVPALSHAPSNPSTTPRPRRCSTGPPPAPRRSSNT